MSGRARKIIDDFASSVTVTLFNFLLQQVNFMRNLTTENLNMCPAA